MEVFKIPIYDTLCKKCKKEEEILTLRISKKIPNCKCGGERIILSPKKSPSFKLIYDPKVDSVDWDGNRSKYFDEYKKQKAEGKNVRIPEMDGEVR